MLENQHYFNNDNTSPHYAPLLYSDDLKLAIFRLNSLGPYIPVKDLVDWRKFDIGQETDQFLQNLATYTLVGVTQGNTYEDSVALLPVAKLKGYKVLLISLLSDEQGHEIHTRYYQIAIFLTHSKLYYLPNIVQMEEKLIELTRAALPDVNNIKIADLLGLKIKLLKFFNDH